MIAKKISSERKKVLQMYTPLSVAKKEVWNRWNDKELRKKVKEFLGGDIPEPFKKEPRAVISRQVISPNTELRYFYNLAKEIKLSPLGLEGVVDKFCTINPEKAALGNMEFMNENKNGDVAKISYLKIIDLKKSEGKKICEIKTLWGENFVDFHHKMLKKKFSNIEMFDDFIWFKEKGFSIKPKDYYKKYLAFFICFGVLFENFSLYRNEKDFSCSTVLPSFLAIEKEFGLKPLIVPLVSLEDEASFYWRCYPNSLKRMVEASLKK